jgi:integrase
MAKEIKETARRANGTGSVVKLRHRDKKTRKMVESRYYYILYRVRGRQVRESSETESKMEAEALLQRRLGEAGLGMRPQQDVKTLKYTEIRDAYVAECRNQGAHFFVQKDGTEYINGVPHLDKFFKGSRVTEINSDTIRSFTEARRKQGAADATIRRNLVTLRAMFNQARKEGKLRLADVPHFPMPKDSKPRQGFVNPDVFGQLREALPKHLRPLITFLYYTGCRVGAAKQITWQMVSKDAKEVELPGEITKSGEPLTLPLVGKGLDEVSAMLKNMKTTFRKDGPIFDATNLRKEWNQTCHDLKLGVYDGLHYQGLKIHDLRRSAARNLIRAGVPRGVAMSITGHKTEHTFERYNITDGADIRDALIKVGDYAKMQGQQKAQRKGTARV